LSVCQKSTTTGKNGMNTPNILLLTVGSRYLKQIKAKYTKERKEKEKEKEKKRK
jgi:hypothetical protein